MIINRHHVISSTEISEMKLQIPDELRLEGVKEAYRVGDTQNQQTNVKGTMSNWQVFRQSTILEEICHKINEAIYDLNYLNFGHKNEIWGLWMESAWTTIYKKDDYTIAHDHKPYHLSFVYYLQSNGSTPICFNDNNFEIHPVSNTLIVFPGNVKHSVPIHNDNEDRICLAGNIIFTLKTT